MKGETPFPTRRSGTKDETAPVRYFLPGQMLLQIEHPAEISTENLREAASKFLATDSGGEEWKKRLEPLKKDSVITLPPAGGSGRATSLVRTEFLDKNIPDKDLLGQNNDLNSQVREKPLEIAPDVTLRAYPLNWLAGGANGQSGTGGPGSWPVQADAPAADGWKFHLLNETGAASALPQTGGLGDGVHVAILDTLPSIHDLDRAYAKWGVIHPLLGEMLKPNGPLRFYPASYADLQPFQGYDLRGHRYLMSDHGLFIAGIIHSIVPNAVLHLYEVLNPYGVGSIEGIARGLAQVLHNPEIQDRQLVVNCSFMFGIPLEETDDPESPFNGMNAAAIKDLALSVQAIFDPVLKRPDTVVVAAAGNEGYRTINGTAVRPPTRYPAYLDAVVGVGALPPSAQPETTVYQGATYSNLSDNPVGGSYITLGGEPGLGNGIRGVFTGDFPIYAPPVGCLGAILRVLGLGALPTPGPVPDAYSLMRGQIRYSRNRTGWAWWAGTSFATPVVSGILASNRSLPGAAISGTPRDPATVLGGIAQPNGTDKKEKVILVRQG